MGDAAGDDRVHPARQLREPRSERARERVAEHGESLEPDLLQHRDQIVGQVADPIGGIRVEPTAALEPARARGDHREAL